MRLLQQLAMIGIHPALLQNRGSIWKHQCACLQAAAAGSNVFGLPTSFAAPLPQHYMVQ